jgi:PAS domain S-box-containing protein
MASPAGTEVHQEDEDRQSKADPKEAEMLLREVAAAFRRRECGTEAMQEIPPEGLASSIEAKYRALLEQIPAVVFMAYIDRGTSEAYVSPEIEAALGYSREEWLEDPARWYERIHPDDKQRWSLETAEMFVSGKPLRSSYRVIAQNGRVVWFRCDARMVRRPDGQPWFIHGVAFDISDLKETERALQQERNFISGIVETVGALITVLDQEGRIVRFNRSCELTTGYKLDEVRGKHIWDFFLLPEEVERSKAGLVHLVADCSGHECQSHWVTRDGSTRLIAWSCLSLSQDDGPPRYIIATGIDITEREHLERALLDVSAREQRRIGQDLHDGLGQHLTGIAFMAKVHEKKLAETDPVAAAEAGKLVRLVNESVHKTRELARGLLPVMSDAQGLMSALQLWAAEVEDIFGISCTFECNTPVLIRDIAVSTHLYHVAQEGVNNAIKHGGARNIILRLSIANGLGALQIVDDGSGIPEDRRTSGGMGLHIMTYRSAMIGGKLEIAGSSGQGTTVTCTFPVGH